MAEGRGGEAEKGRARQSLAIDTEQWTDPDLHVHTDKHPCLCPSPPLRAPLPLPSPSPVILARAMRDELEEARAEVRGLAQHLQAAEGKVVEAEKVVQRERRAHKELEDEANQWRRYALR